MSQRRGFRDRVFSASAWGWGASAVRYSFELVMNIALARLLTPDDFGLVAAATPVSGIMVALGDVGFGAALVQRKDIRPEHYNAVFWLAACFALVLGGVTAVSGPAVAWFYGRHELLAIMPVLAIQFPLGVIRSVPQAQLSRELRFPLMAKLELIGMLISGSLAIGLSLAGGGVWALVVRPLIVQATLAVGAAWFVRWRPTGFIERSAMREVVKFSASYYGAQLLRYASRNADSVAIGRVYGSVELGYYSRAYTLMTLPIVGGARAVLSVLFAAFSNIQDDHERIRAIYLKFSGALALFIVPMMLGAAVVAESVIVALLGEAWAPMAPVFQVLAVSGIWQAVNAIHDALYLSQGRSDLRLRYSLVGRVMIIIGIVVGLPFGIVGVAVGFAVGSAIDNALSVSAAGRLVGLRGADLVRHLRSVVGLGSVMAAVVWGVSVGTPVREYGHWARIGILIPLGATVYAGLLVLVRPQPYRDVFELVRARRAKRP